MNDLVPYVPLLVAALSIVALWIRNENRLTRLETLHEKTQEAKPKPKKRRR